MSTKAEQRRQRKRKARERKIRKAHNIFQNNMGVPKPDKFALEVIVDGIWRPIKGFKSWEGVEAHQNETERLRSIGHEIVEGRVRSLSNGDIVLVIQPSKPKGALPDKLSAMPESADKAVIDNKKDLPDNLK
jgi:hypothetical protein